MYKPNAILAYLEDVYYQVGKLDADEGVLVLPNGTGGEAYKRHLNRVEARTADTDIEDAKWADFAELKAFELLSSNNSQEVIDRIDETCAVLLAWKRNLLDR